MMASMLIGFADSKEKEILCRREIELAQAGRWL
jgi:hypothetical protein